MPIVRLARHGRFCDFQGSQLKDIVEKAKSGYQDAKSYWSEIYQLAKDDLLFLSGKEGCQWDARAYNRRKAKNRPALQIDRLTQYVNQVSNDIRMNTPSINVIPHGGPADIETAEIYQGLIRDIEQHSRADDAYDYAVSSSIKCSVGFIRVDHRYKDDVSFDQELYIERVVNPLGVLLDPASIMSDGSDAMCAWVLDELSVKDFKKKYPDFDPVSFGDEKASKETDMLVICEYFKIKEEKITLALLEDGSSVEYQEGMPVPVIETRETTKRVIYRYRLSGQDVLEETTFPGKYIPIVPVYGEEAWIDGERHIHSLIRKAKDPQQRYNFWASTEAELLMKSPKATIIAVGGTTENYADDYKDPDNAIVLRYDQTDARGNPAPPPQINQGPGIPSGIVNAMAQAADDIKSTLGLYDAFVGQRSNETSGVAIRERKLEGDRAVYHFGDNLVRSITQVGRVLVSAIPEIYNRPRIVSIVGKEEKSEKIGINGAMVEGQERPFNLIDGQYNVVVTTGASYATMRQEAAEFFQQVIQSQPQLIQVAGDLLFKYMDFPGAQALSERIKKTIPPQILDETSQDPQAAALAQENEQLKQALTAIQAQMNDKRAEIDVKVLSEQNDAQESATKAQLEIAKLRLEQQKISKEFELKTAELALKARELALKENQALVAAQQPVAEFMPQ